MNLENIHLIIANALPGCVVTESLCRVSGKNGYLFEVTIREVGCEHRFVDVKFVEEKPPLEKVWRQVIEQLQKCSLTRAEHEAVDRAILEIG